jgi:hypothetical protein
MADTKISALTSATVPLAGTEVLPIVQSGSTVKVAVSDLTAARAVSATQYTSTIATGTAPLVIASTTNVANLNASSLNGATFAAPGAIGGGTASAITGTTIAGTDTTDATSTTAAALKTAGGLAVVKKTYVGDNIVQATAAKGVDFSANTPLAGKTSTLLNWYEEGTWTPAQGSGLTVVGAFSSVGRYIRIGKQVTVNGSVSGATSVALAGGAAILTNNLPFSPGSVPGTGTATNAGATTSSIFQASVTTIYNVTAIGATTTIYFSVTYNLN